jgi:NADPH-dependent 2,4-dienoyl-CoA reductase/sulfur reductase-like enzyme
MESKMNDYSVTGYITEELEENGIIVYTERKVVGIYTARTAEDATWAFEEEYGSDVVVEKTQILP